MRASVRKTAVNVCYRCDFGEHTGNNNNNTYKQKLVQEVETSKCLTCSTVFVIVKLVSCQILVGIQLHANKNTPNFGFNHTFLLHGINFKPLFLFAITIESHFIIKTDDY